MSKTTRAICLYGGAFIAVTEFALSFTNRALSPSTIHVLLAFMGASLAYLWAKQP